MKRLATLRLPLTLAALLGPEQIVERAVTLARADRQQSLCVTGPDGLLAIAALRRAGFLNLEHAGAGWRPGYHDMLLVLGSMSSSDRRSRLNDTCNLLSDGGVVAVQLERASDDIVVRWALTNAGMRVASTVFDLPYGHLVTHRCVRELN